MKDEDFGIWFIRIVESYELDLGKATELLNKILEVLCGENANDK